MRNSTSIVTALVTFVSLIGCKANQESLVDYLAEVEAKSQQEVAQLTPVIAFQAFEYAQHDAREPFVLPREAIAQNQPITNRHCWQPKSRGKTTSLERYPLNQLQLRGVMRREREVSALIQTPDGMVVTLQAGQYVGVNNGQVIRVAEDHLLIKETLPDGLGCWNQRHVTLTLK